MDQSVKTKKTTTVTTHPFWCDDCNTYIGSTVENSDGYYPKLEEHEWSIYLPHKGYLYLRRCLCRECLSKFQQRLESHLREIGFTSEDDNT